MNPRPADLYVLPTIDFVGGSTQELLFRTYYERNKIPIDLSSCTANFSVVNYVNKNGEPLIQKSMIVVEGDTYEGSATSNVLKVILLPSDTVDLVGKFIYQITISDGAGIVDIPSQGIMRIANNINKEFIKQM